MQQVNRKKSPPFHSNTFCRENNPPFSILNIGSVNPSQSDILKPPHPSTLMINFLYIYIYFFLIHAHSNLKVTGTTKYMSCILRNILTCQVIIWFEKNFYTTFIWTYVNAQCICTLQIHCSYFTYWQYINGNNIAFFFFFLFQR